MSHCDVCALKIRFNVISPARNFSEHNIDSRQQTCMNNSFRTPSSEWLPPRISAADYTVQIYIVSSGASVHHEREWDFDITICILINKVFFSVCGLGNQPWLLEKCWKTSEQDKLTTCPTSALCQHPMLSHSVLHPVSTNRRSSRVG